MKIAGILIISSLFSLSLQVAGAPVDRFPGGNAEIVVDLSGIGHFTMVNITLPANCFVFNATMNVTDMTEAGAYPESPEVLLNNSKVWGFNSTLYGALGMQNRIGYWEGQTRIQLGQGGGTRKAPIRLPIGALVHNATMDIGTGGPDNLTQLLNITGVDWGRNFGGSVSTAGDVNGDGFDDVIVGAMGLDINDPAAGRAYIYFGGPSMDNSPDVTLRGAAANDAFGCSVSNAGDVNRDGYDDVIVGAYADSTGGAFAGRAYIYFGGSLVDSTADVTLTGAAKGDNFGWSVSSAGDVNGDGYDDAIVGIFANRAYIYYGGHAMNNVADVTLNGAAAGDGFGYSVSDAGDMNGDGFDDVIVGANNNDTGGKNAGRAYVFFGGHYMDDMPDVAFTGEAAGDWFGLSVSAAGDVNGDGYGDVIVLAPINNASGDYEGGAYVFFGGVVMDSTPDVKITGDSERMDFYRTVSNAGDVNKDGYDDVLVKVHVSRATQALIFFGGTAMDGIADMTLSGASSVANFGGSISCAGDVNGDGYDDVILGAACDKSRPDHVYIFSWLSGTMNPKITVGPVTIWNRTGCINGTGITGDFGDALNAYLRSASPTDWDHTGNHFVDIPVNVSADSEGTFTLSNLSVDYRYVAVIPDFAAPLNDYILNHKDEKDARGNITVPMIVQAHGACRLKLFDLKIIFNRPPAFEGFPSTVAQIGKKYIYNARAVDADGDSTRFYLLNSSKGMSIDPATGQFNWTPAASQRGNHTVIIVTDDGRGGVVQQNFTINVGSRENTPGSPANNGWYMIIAVIVISCVLVITIFRWKFT